MADGSNLFYSWLVQHEMPFRGQKIKDENHQASLKDYELVAGRAIFKLGGNITLVKRHMSLTLHT